MVVLWSWAACLEVSARLVSCSTIVICEICCMNAVESCGCMGSWCFMFSTSSVMKVLESALKAPAAVACEAAAGELVGEGAETGVVLMGGPQAWTSTSAPAGSVVADVESRGVRRSSSSSAPRPAPARPAAGAVPCPRGSR